MGTKSRKPHQLPPGKHGLTTEYVARNQRERILAAVAEAVSATGYAQTTVETIIHCAGVSRRSFYQHFANKQDAFLAAFDRAVADVTAQLIEAYTAEDEYVSSVRAGLDRVLRALADNPAATKMIIVEVMSAGPEALQRRREVLTWLTDQIADASQGFPYPAMGPQLTAETIVGGVLQVIHNRVYQGEAKKLPELAPDLLYSVLVPFVGHERAADERRAVLDGK